MATAVDTVWVGCVSAPSYVDLLETNMQDEEEEQQAPPPAMMSVAERLMLSLYDENDSSMTHLQEILSEERDDLDDDDINDALCQAAHDGKEEAVRILLLGESDKRMYTDNGVVQITGHRRRGPLHLAAVHCHVPVVRFLVEVCRANINQFDNYAFTPLSLAIFRYCSWTCSIPWEPRLSAAREACILETCRVLLKNGADPDHCVEIPGTDGGLKCHALLRAIESGMLEVVRLLLDHGADPNIDRGSDIEADYGGPSAADTAIFCGQAEILDLLLERGAVVEPPSREEREDYERMHPQDVPKTVLYQLLNGIGITHDAKLSICRTLVEHAKSDEASALLLHLALEDAMKTAIESAEYMSPWQLDTDCCETLFAAGMCPIQALYRAIQDGKRDYCWLLTKLWVENPFEEMNGSGTIIDDAAVSPVHEAARLEDTCILKLFLDRRDTRDIPNSDSENDDENCEESEESNVDYESYGRYYLHSICRDPKVSLPAVKLLLECETGAALIKADYKQGLFPVEIAATSDTSLDVIYSLLRPYPDVLRRLSRGRACAGAPNNNSNDDPDNDSNSTEDCDEPTKKKAKTTR